MQNGRFSHIQPGSGVIYPPRGLPAICAPITVGFYMVRMQPSLALSEHAGWTLSCSLAMNRHCVVLTRML
eukprot:SAG31_NODE_4355_length_3319_cov_1.559938_2_plen_70_part_00